MKGHVRNSFTISLSFGDQSRDKCRRLERLLVNSERFHAPEEREREMWKCVSVSAFIPW